MSSAATHRHISNAAVASSVSFSLHYKTKRQTQVANAERGSRWVAPSALGQTSKRADVPEMCSICSVCCVVVMRMRSSGAIIPPSIGHMSSVNDFKSQQITVTARSLMVEDRVAFTRAATWRTHLCGGVLSL